MNYDLLVWIFETALPLVISIVSAVVLYCRTGDKNFLKKVDKYEMEKKKYVQTWKEEDSFKPVYKVNSRTGELEDTGERIDIQGLIESCRDYCLDACLERLMLNNSVPDGYIDGLEDEQSQYWDDLDEMTAAIDLAEEYRDKLNLPLTADLQTIFKAVQHAADDLGAQIDKLKGKGGEKSGEISQTSAPSADSSAQTDTPNKA